MSNRRRSSFLSPHICILLFFLSPFNASTFVAYSSDNKSCRIQTKLSNQSPSNPLIEVFFSCNFIQSCTVNCPKSPSFTSTLLAQKACSQICCPFQFLRNQSPYFCVVSAAFDYRFLITVLVLVLAVGIPIIVILSLCLKKIMDSRSNNLSSVIEANTIKVSDYNKAEVGSYLIDPKDECSICLCDNNEIMTRCFHTYHFACLKSWIKKKKKTCPLCLSHEFNPVKVYCMKCHVGMELVIITASDERESVQDLQCQNCDKNKINQLHFSIDGQQQDNIQENVENIVPKSTTNFLKEQSRQ